MGDLTGENREFGYTDVEESILATRYLNAYLRTRIPEAGDRFVKEPVSTSKPRGIAIPIAPVR